MRPQLDWNRIFELTWRILVFIVAIAITVVTSNWNRWEGRPGWQSTDDAYLQSDLTPISARSPEIRRGKGTASIKCRYPLFGRKNICRTFSVGARPRVGVLPAGKERLSVSRAPPAKRLLTHEVT